MIREQKAVAVAKVLNDGIVGVPEVAGDVHPRTVAPV